MITTLIVVALVVIAMLSTGCTIDDVIPPMKKIKKWDECTKSSNWTGKNAAKRIMNILSPNMSDASFNERYNFAKGRGVNYFAVFLTNHKDGEYAGYSPFGKSFNIDKGTDKASCEVMTKRINKMLDDDIAFVPFMMADDSNDWARTAASKWDKYCKALKDLGWLDKASMVVIGLEIEEYWKDAKTVSNLISILRKYYNGKIGTHHVSNSYGLALGDVAFLQMNPGQSDSAIKSYVNKAKSALKKPVCMFELERNEDRHRSQVALDAGAFSCGNW